MQILDPAELSGNDAHRLLTSLFIPRPIALVGTIGTSGVTNCAPYSFSAGISSKPPILMVAIGPRRDGTPKDTLRNIMETGEFTINLVSEPLLERMHRSSLALPPEVSEFDVVGLSPRKSQKVAAPGVEESPVTFEMRVRQVMNVEGTASTIILGDVVLFQVMEGLLVDGQARPEDLHAVGRLGQDSYTVVERIIRLDPVR